jgi:hypothetical protein
MPLGFFGIRVVSYLRDTVCEYPLIIFVANTLMFEEKPVGTFTALSH